MLPNCCTHYARNQFVCAAGARSHHSVPRKPLKINCKVEVIIVDSGARVNLRIKTITFLQIRTCSGGTEKKSLKRKVPLYCYKHASKVELGTTCLWVRRSDWWSRRVFGLNTDGWRVVCCSTCLLIRNTSGKRICPHLTLTARTTCHFLCVHLHTKPHVTTKGSLCLFIVLSPWQCVDLGNFFRFYHHFLKKKK